MLRKISALLPSEELSLAQELVSQNKVIFGSKYNNYIAKAVQILKTKDFDLGALTELELTQLVEIVDVSGIDSVSSVKKLSDQCLRCGWCCAKTQKIIVEGKDASRISRALKKPIEELFIKESGTWKIKKASPCQWWNPQNHQCSIYNIRPQTCRDWPLGVNDDGFRVVQPQYQCNYSVMVLVAKVMAAIGIG